MALITTDSLTKIYQLGENSVQALKEITITINENEFLAIKGTSGSGKSTLMHILGCLDRPTNGTYFLDGQNVAELSKDELAHIRNKKIGFVFQRFHLLPDLNATDNVALPLLYAGIAESNARQQARKMLSMVELGDRLDHYPYQLSGGQRQRVTIARSLINQPRIIFADEPTGNLDTKTGETIMGMFKELHRQQGVTIILVTHEPDIAEQTERVITLVDGGIIKDTKKS